MWTLAKKVEDKPEDGEGNILLMGTINIPSQWDNGVSFCGSVMNNWKAQCYLIPGHEYSGCGIMGGSGGWEPSPLACSESHWSILSHLSVQPCRLSPTIWADTIYRSDAWLSIKALLRGCTDWSQRSGSVWVFLIDWLIAGLGWSVIDYE